MRKILFLLFAFVVSCSEPTSVNLESVEVSDSILFQSDKNLMVADTIAKLSDSSTKERIVLVVSEINYLTKEIEKFKTERITLESKLKETSEKIIYRIDTVYIETKKNFWGKEKTNISTKSDSSVQINSDTLVNTLQSIDTLKVIQ